MQPATEIKIQAKDLVKRYGATTAVAGVSLEVKAGEIFGLLGPNGAGKTTTIEMMEGLRQPDSGSCRICGFDSVTQSARVRERLGLSLQSANMPDDATVLELLTLYASFYPNPKPIGELLSLFNLKEKARAKCAGLSGGQKQRLALALALVGRPEVIFLDEPTTGLDPQSRRSLWDVIRGLREEGRAVVMSTHYMEEAERLCDRVAIMDHGRILAEGTPRELIRAHGPESAIELEMRQPADLAALARLPGATGIKAEENQVVIYSANTMTTLMALAAHVQEHSLLVGDLRTRSGSMEDVFIAMTGRSLRD